MQNPFESGHIKNYILLYVSVVVIMVLFFIASTLFHDVKDVEKKVFNTEASEVLAIDENIIEDKSPTSKFRLLEVNLTSYSGYSKSPKVQKSKSQQTL